MPSPLRYVSEIYQLRYLIAKGLQFLNPHFRHSSSATIRIANGKANKLSQRVREWVPKIIRAKIGRAHV